MRTRKINKTIVVVLAICTAFLISSMCFIPSNAETTGDLVTWGEAEDPNSYDRTNEDASQWTRPKKDGYYFAGWYESQESTEAIANIAEVTSAYPKFVREDVLTVKCQVALKNASGQLTSLDSKATAMVDVRIMTSVDNLQYQAVSFLLGTNKSQELIVEKVYKSVTGQDKDREIYTYTSTNVCGDNTKGYLVAGYIRNLASYANAAGVNSFERNIVITPTWTTMDGTVVVAKEATTKQVVEDSRIAACEAILIHQNAAGDTEINWYNKLSDAVSVVSEKTSDVTIDVRKDNAKLPSHAAYTKTDNTTYTLNGNGHKLDASGCGNSSLFICQSANKTFVLKNATINHGTTGTSKIFTTNKSFTLQMYDVKINSTAVDAGEQALFAATSTSYNTQIGLDITMDNVHVTWNPGKTQRGFFDFQYDVNANMQVTNSSFKAEGSVITNTVYWRYYKSYILNLTVDDVSKPYFDGLVKHSQGAVTLNMSDYVEQGENETPSVPIS